MSYSITEAERKHVATIEDTSFKIERVGTAEDTTPQYNLHMTDGDKLDLNIELPKLRFECNNEDDKHSRIRVIASDSVGEDHEIVLDGLTGRSGNPLGLGWRFKVTFGTDDDGFINKMIVERKNDGKTWTNDINAFSDLIIKNLVIGSDDVEGSGNLEVKGESTFKKSVTGTDATFNDVEIGKDNIAIKSNGKDSILDDVRMTAAHTAGLDVADGDTQISNEQVNISNTSVVADNNSTFDISNADVTNLHSANASIETLDSNKTTSHDTVLDGTTYVHDDFTADNLNVNERIDTKDLRVTNQFEANKAAVSTIVANDKVITNKANVENARITTESVGTSSINEASINNLEAITGKVSDLESNNIKTRKLDTDSIDAGLADFEEIEAGKVKTDDVQSLDGSNLISDKDGDINIGDGNKELILNSAPSGLDPNDKAYNRIKVICGDNVSHLATLEDLKEENLNGVVDLTTNQTVGGVKRFKDQINAEVGMVSPDDTDQDKVVNLITRLWDPNDPDVAFVINPEFTAAQEMAEEYDDNLAKYNDVSKKYAAALRTKREYENTAADLESKTAYKDNLTSELSTVNEEISIISARIAETTANKERDEADKAAKVTEIAVLGGSESIARRKSNHDVAEICIETLTTWFNELVSADGATSVIFDNAALASLKDESIPLENRIAILRRFVSEYSQDQWLESYEAADNEINTLYKLTIDVNGTTRTISNVHNILDVYDFLVAFINGYTSHDEEDLARSIELENSVVNLTEAIANYEAALVEDNALLSAKTTQKTNLTSQISEYETLISGLTVSKNEKETTKNEKLEEFQQSYAIYEGIDEDIENINLVEPRDPKEKTENYDAVTYKRFKLGLINEKIPSAEHDKIVVVGNRLDELQFESDSLENGDEHLQATIGGKYHKLANLDDIILSDFAFKTGDKVVGDTDINTLDNEIEFKVTKDTVKKALSITPQDEQNMENSAADDPSATIINTEPEAVTETIFTLKGSSVIKISKENENEDVAVISLNDEAFEASLRSRDAKFFVTKEGNGTKVDQKYPNGDVADTINFKSDRDHLIIENEGDKTTKFDINVYEPDMDLGAETVRGYVNAYERLEAIPDNLDLIPNAIAVKSLHTDSGTKIQKVQHELDTRVPPSPKIAGRYGLVATVVSNDAGGVSSVYSWDGTITGLPEVYDTNVNNIEVNTYINKTYIDSNGEERTEQIPVTMKKDWNGNPIEFYTPDHPIEYIPKMRVYANPDGRGKTKLTTVINWIPMDYAGSSTPTEENVAPEPQDDLPEAYIGD